MNCDDFLAAIQTDGWLSRWRARRHAARCNECAETLAMLDELRATEPLPERLRRNWMAVAENEQVEVPTTTIRVWFRPALAVAAVLLLSLIPIAVYRFNKPPQIVHPTPTTARVPENRNVGPITVVHVNVADQMTQLDKDVLKLQSRVRELAAVADRLAAHKQLTQVLARHSKW